MLFLILTNIQIDCGRKYLGACWKGWWAEPGWSWASDNAVSIPVAPCSGHTLLSCTLQSPSAHTLHTLQCPNPILHGTPAALHKKIQPGMEHKHNSACICDLSGAAHHQPLLYPPAHPHPPAPPMHWCTHPLTLGANINSPICPRGAQTV